jgi:protein-glutamine gamma-glutamyltransferase
MAPAGALLRKRQLKTKGWGPQSKPLEVKSWGTWILAVLGSFAVFLLRLQGETFPVALIIEFAALIVGSGFIHSLMGRTVAKRGSDPTRRDTSRWLLYVGVLVIATPWIRNVVTRVGFGASGEATELVWLGMLQHAAIWQAAVATTARQEWLSFLLSCFMMLFGTATSDRAGMFLVVVPFGLFAAWWLLSQYWKSVAQGFVATSSVPLVRLRIGIIAALCLLTVVVGAIAVGTGHSIVSLDGFMPTSGGKGGSDPAARQGVGDGDMMVAAKDQAFSFGPVESDMFLESELPSLYDLASERYGDIKKRNKEYSRAVSLEQQAKHTHETITESKQKGREFSTLRNPSQKANASRPKDSQSRSVVQIIGSTPQHLRLESYDTFDGIEWDHSDIDHKAKATSFQMTELGSKPWAVVNSFPTEIVWPVRDRVTVKVINLKSTRIMSPSLTTHVHVDKVAQEDFYSLSPDGQLIMPSRPFIPQLTVLHLLHQTPCLHPLRQPFEVLSGLAMDRRSLRTEETNVRYWMRSYLEIPSSVERLNERLHDLISHIPERVQSRWTDWQRVEAIVDALRDQVVVDQEVELPDNVEESATYVLEHKRGTDYLVATSAAMLIRHLNIPARLVTGFYARPERFDVKAGLTEVLPEDLHTWVEVYVHGAWIPVEPSGTYAKPRENRSWMQWGIETAWWIHDAAITYPVRTACGFLLVSSLFVMRRRIANAIASFLSLGLLWLPGPGRLYVSLRLLRFRRWLSGMRKPRGWTIARWLDDELRYHPHISKTEKESFVQMVQRRIYAPRTTTNPSSAAILRTHDRVLRSIVWQGIADLFRYETIFRQRKRHQPTPASSFKRNS